MGHHAVHILAGLSVLFGLFAGSWALERKPLLVRDDADPPSRGEWERRLSGMGLGGPRSAVRPPVGPPPATSLASLTARRAAALSLFAGAIHLAALPEHLSESIWFAAFFLWCGAYQVLSGVALRVHSSRRLYLLVAVVNAGVVALW